jgi:ATP-dependent Clp protease, protease subunit
MKNKYGFEIVNKTEDVGEVYMYGYITDEKWYDTDVTPTELKKEFASLKGKKAVNLYVNSGGGGVFAGMAIYSMIKRMSDSGTVITAYVDGLAASIASVIVMAASKIVMPSNALMMIHNPWSMAAGAADDLRKEAEALDKVKEVIVNVYAEKTGMSNDDISELMTDETWMTGEDALAFGFANETTAPVAMAASADKTRVKINSVEHVIDNGLRKLPLENIPVDKAEQDPESNTENNADIVPVDFSYYDNCMKLTESIISTF